MSRITDLLAQVSKLDARLGDDLSAEVKALSKRRAFGLNFERHKPEVVELPGRPVRKGDKVRNLPARDGSSVDHRLWVVTSFTADRSAAQIVCLDTDSLEQMTVAIDELVVVAEFRDPIYPGLVSTGSIANGASEQPFHSVIKAENFHALQALSYTHEGSIDAIYIDPPYNTGNQGWIYNDSYVAADDIYKHSKWLAFMERRLVLAKRLLKPTGVIIVAIGDDEHHRLRMLMDQVFGAENFLANLIWQGNLKSDARFGGGGTDYMVVYGASATELAQAGSRWMERKPGVDEILAAAAQAWSNAEGDASRATELLKQWWKKVPADSPWRANQEYKNVDHNGEAYLAGPIDSPSYRPNLMYELRHPTTGNPVPVPKNGWRVARDRMAELIAEGEVVFRPDDTTLPSRKFLLRRVDSRVPDPTFRTDRRSSSTRLAGVLGDRRFPFPKDHEVLMRWLRMVAPQDATILDFFGGSGSTAEAVMRLNEEDGGTRQCVLVTNNEVSSDDAKKLRKGGFRHGDPEWEDRGVYEYVAKPRVSTIVSGIREDGSTYSDGLKQNVEFFTLTYEVPTSVQYGRSFKRIAPLLWLRAGARGRRIDEQTDDFDIADTYAVLFDLDYTREFIKAVGSRYAESSTRHPTSDEQRLRTAFIVTDDDRGFQQVVAELPEGIEPVRLYSSYLTNFSFTGDVE